MIDLHSHILPGLDDGPADLEGSLALAREAVARDTTTIVATPHIRGDHGFPLGSIEAGVHGLSKELAERGIDLEVLAGGEVAVSKVHDLDAPTLRNLCLGDSSYILVESPYSYSSGVLEAVLRDLRGEGLRPMLAHPERSPSFTTDYVRLQRIVADGVLCSVTAGSMEGNFGARVRDFTARLFSDGLVHNVASDAHSARNRPPGLGDAFAVLNEDLPGLRDQQSWYAQEVPASILADGELPERPSLPIPRRRGLRRFLSGSLGLSRPADGDAVR
jgi:protein-tyrosine phosphatase